MIYKKEVIIINNLYEKNLPSLLTIKETKKLFLEMNKGSKISRDKLISSNIRLVFNRAKKFLKYVNIEENELISVGNIGLIKAVDTFDILRGIEFSTYACKCIDNELYNVIKKSKSRIKIESLNNLIYSNNDNTSEFTLLDTICDSNNTEENYEEKELKLILHKLVDNLEEKDKKIIKMYYGFGGKKYTQAEISKILNMKRTTLCMRKNTIIKKLKIQLYKIYNMIDNENLNINKKNRKLKTIYEFFEDYTREEIDEILKKLDFHKRQLIELRFGKNLEEKKFSKLPDSYKIYFYKHVISEIRLNLKNSRLNNNITNTVNDVKKVSY